MCNCGCNTCKTKIRGPLLTEGLISKSLLSEGLQYHIDKQIPLMENVFRIGSDAHLSMIKEARKLYTRNVLDLCEEDEALMETHIGEFDLYENEIVPLDLPMLDEEKGYSPQLVSKENPKGETKGLDSETMSKILMKIIKGVKEGNIKESTNKLNPLNENQVIQVSKAISDAISSIDDSLSYKTFASSIAYILKREYGSHNIEPFMKVLHTELDINDSLQEVKINRKKIESILWDLKNSNKLSNPSDPKKKEALIKKLEKQLSMLNESELEEAEFKGKEVSLNKPKRGGSKAYYVYVKDGDKVKKVTFGSGGLRAKIKNKEARNAFAARHNCKDKKDRTKAGYWSCNLPRYASQLGLGANMNTFW